MRIPIAKPIKDFASSWNGKHTILKKTKYIKALEQKQYY